MPYTDYNAYLEVFTEYVIIMNLLHILRLMLRVYYKGTSVCNGVCVVCVSLKKKSAYADSITWLVSMYVCKYVCKCVFHLSSVSPNTYF